MRPSQAGSARPFVIAGLVLFVYLGIRISMGFVVGKQFETDTRNVILMNPMMKDDEFKMRLEKAAKKGEVELDLASVRIDRSGLTNLAAGGIASVRIRFTVSTPLLLTTWRRTVEAEVRP